MGVEGRPLDCRIVAGRGVHRGHGRFSFVSAMSEERRRLVSSSEEMHRTREVV